jgi:hypothetical protein
MVARLEPGLSPGDQPATRTRYRRRVLMREVQGIREKARNATLHTLEHFAHPHAKAVSRHRARCCANSRLRIEHVPCAIETGILPTMRLKPRDRSIIVGRYEKKRSLPCLSYHMHRRALPPFISKRYGDARPHLSLKMRKPYAMICRERLITGAGTTRRNVALAPPGPPSRDENGRGGGEKCDGKNRLEMLALSLSLSREEKNR